MLTRGPKLVREAEVQKTPLFARFARWVERQVGRSSTFMLAIAVVLLWAVSGPFFGWSDSWQLVINTGTTIVTFLMVFVIQNTQSRDTQAMQLKLDELIRVNEMARNFPDQPRRNVRPRCRADEESFCSARVRNTRATNTSNRIGSNDHRNEPLRSGRAWRMPAVASGSTHAARLVR
jgi:hypothetical protein